MALVFAVMHLCNMFNFLLLLSIPISSSSSSSFFFFFFFFKSDVDKSTEWSTIPVWSSLMFFFNRGNSEGTNSSKILCLTFVYALLYANLCQD